MQKIKIKSRTWTKDSYGLFDYETTTELNKQELSILKEGIIIREKDNLRYVPDKSNIFVNEHEDYLFSIIRESGNTLISNSKNYEVWTTLTSKFGGDIKDSITLKEKDSFKLGKIVFEVLKIKDYEDKKKKLYYDSVLNSLKNHYKKEGYEYKKNTYETEPGTLNDIKLEKLIIEDSSEKKLCRFCLSDTIVSENPLLSLCRCDGSLKYVHLSCIQSWLVSKLHLKQINGVFSILWNALCCELCKTPLPLTFEHDENYYDLIDFKSLGEDSNDCVKTLLLQSYTKNGKPSGLHFINAGTKKSIKIGRGNECEIKMSDISVSRLHAYIKFENDKFILKDNCSKFGSLYLIKESIPIFTNHILVQFGRSVLEIYTSKKWFANLGCFACTDNDVEEKTAKKIFEEHKH